MGTELAEQQKGGVPALANTPAVDIGAEDVQLPRVYTGSFTSQAVKDGLAPLGSIYTALDKDDPDPQVVFEQGGKPVRFHVLGLRRGKSVNVDGDYVLYDFNDPDAPPEAWTTYNYVVALPKVDEDFPYKWSLSRSAQPTARGINTVIVRNQDRGPVYALAFEAVAIKRTNPKGEWYSPRVKHVEADKADLEVVEGIVSLLPSDVVEVESPKQPEVEPGI
jgi:hypothetical protein